MRTEHSGIFQMTTFLSLLEAKGDFLFSLWKSGRAPGGTTHNVQSFKLSDFSVGGNFSIILQVLVPMGVSPLQSSDSLH